VPARFVGSILTRDLTVAGTRWAKGRRLSADDLSALAGADPGDPVSVLVPEAGDLHEDDAAIRLAAAVAGTGLVTRGPAQSRVDLVAEADGVLNVRVGDLERLNRIDPLEVFTGFDGQVVARGDLVASVKVAPHLVDAATVDAGARLAGFGSHPLVWVAPFVPCRVGVIVKESVRATARERFETSVRAKIEGLGSEIESIEYVEDDADEVEAAMAGFVRRPDPLDLILTAGAASTDPLDACLWRSPRSAVGSFATASRRTRVRCSGSRASVGRPSSACRPAAPTRRRRRPTSCCRDFCPEKVRRSGRSPSSDMAGS
jgi:molybdenum cofactor cytidylyltransferase